MSIELLVTSPKKGSNPGGLCRINDGKNQFNAYFKYVIGSKIPRKYSVLEADHQPVYEAITFELARRIGLKTPPFYVLLNNHTDVRISDSRRFSDRDHSGRKYYFVSRVIEESKTDKQDLNQFGEGVVNMERPYLELLQIEDILGVRQNYIVDLEASSVYYVDLGCSFVHAKSGFIYFPNRLRRINHGPKDRKKDKCHLKNKSIIKSDNVGDSVNLGEIISNFENITIPVLNPSGRVKVSDLLNANELGEIKEYIAHGFCENLKSLAEKRILITG